MVRSWRCCLDAVTVLIEVIWKRFLSEIDSIRTPSWRWSQIVRLHDSFFFSFFRRLRHKLAWVSLSFQIILRACQKSIECSLAYSHPIHWRINLSTHSIVMIFNRIFHAMRKKSIIKIFTCRWIPQRPISFPFRVPTIRISFWPMHKSTWRIISIGRCSCISTSTPRSSTSF